MVRIMCFECKLKRAIEIKERQKLTKIEKGIMYVLASTGLLISVIIKMWK